ncbi:hypothetical protein ACFPRL_17715 [Pseudoclavibacter helvolus]
MRSRRSGSFGSRATLTRWRLDETQVRGPGSRSDESNVTDIYSVKMNRSVLVTRWRISGTSNARSLSEISWRSQSIAGCSEPMIVGGVPMVLSSGKG